jgi:uncharacterized protein (DUF1015 family)
MRINPFKLISFDSKYWALDNLYQTLDNRNIKDKITKTKSIMEFLQKNISKGYAKIESSKGLYIFQVSNGEKCITSVIGELSYDEKASLIPNEEIHNDKLNAYKSIFNQYGMQINPVLTVYKNGPSIISITDSLIKREPDIKAVINKDSIYKLWKIQNPSEIEFIQKSLSQIGKLYIADGHHRFAIFKDSQQKISAKIMVSITDSESILLKSCHRVITTKIPSNWKDVLAKYCTIEKSKDNLFQGQSIILKCKNEDNYKITFKNEFTEGASIHSLIKNLIITEAFGIHDHNNQVFPLPGNVSLGDSDKIFDIYKESSTIIFIPPLEISEFFRIIDSDKTLPATSTWFEPKIIDGFLISKF